MEPEASGKYRKCMNPEVGDIGNVENGWSRDSWVYKMHKIDR